MTLKMVGSIWPCTPAIKHQQNCVTSLWFTNAMCWQGVGVIPHWQPRFRLRHSVVWNTPWCHPMALASLAVLTRHWLPRAWSAKSFYPYPLSTRLSQHWLTVTWSRWCRKDLCRISQLFTSRHLHSLFQVLRCSCYGRKDCIETLATCGCAISSPLDCMKAQIDRQA